MHASEQHLRRVLQAMAGPQAQPRTDQTAAVAALVEQRARVLVVQATGWGKSAVYWAATSALRAAGAGPTLIVSPLLALMRDQVAAASRAGLRAATVNSTNLDDWDAVFADIAAGTLDVLLVSPERLGNPGFARRLPTLLASAGLVVIDEAHCISDWGFDFRPDYQRLSRTLLATGADTPVLATTATANQRVTQDVAAQLGAGTLTFRGTLARASLRLAVVPGLGALQRYAWVADALAQAAGSGIVYTLTVAEAERLAAFLAGQGFAVAAYHGGLETAQRQRVEDALRDNRLKAVVATSALGMGYDKPDLAFCFHVGSPASPVAYYQQVGRAGRALDDAIAVLLPAETDDAIWAYFATAGVPDPARVGTLLAALEGGPLSVPALEAATGIRRGRLEGLLKILAVQDVVQREGSAWALTGQPWHFDAERWAALARVREQEAGLMRRYVAGAGCLMRFLQTALDDPAPQDCGRCSVCTGWLPHPGREPGAAAIEAARVFARGRDTVIEPRKLWPAGLGAGFKGRITGCEEGRALAFADDPGWAEPLRRLWAAASASASAGHSDRGRDAAAATADPMPPASEDPAQPPPLAIPPELLDGVVALLARWRSRWPARPVAVVPVPSLAHGAVVTELAAHIACVGRLPVLDLLCWTGPAPDPEAASGARVAALLRGLQLQPGATVPAGPLLLVDARYRSGWTATVAAARLRKAGATAVLPLVLQQLP